MNPVAYARYVNLEGEEAIVVAFRHSSGLTIITHENPYKFGNDRISLMKKINNFKIFLKHIVEIMNIQLPKKLSKYFLLSYSNDLL